MKIISKIEYAKFKTEVNTNFRRFEGRNVAVIIIDNKYYVFEIYGFDDYVVIQVGDIDDDY